MATGVLLDGPSSIVPWLWAVAVLLGLAFWLLAARTVSILGGSMDHSARVPQLYGYSVCLVAIVVILLSVSSIVDNVFRLADPLASSSEVGWGGGPSLTSFEAYEATRDRVLMPIAMIAGQPAERAEPSLEERRVRYEALRADQLAYVRHDAVRALTRSSLLLALATALLIWHWRWTRTLQRRPGSEEIFASG